MVDASSHDDSLAALPAFLASEARRASDGQLALAATLGLVVAAVALLWRPDGSSYFLASGLTCGAFGGWGIADRLLSERGDAGSRGAILLRSVRLLCALTGAVAGALLVIRILFIGLGTWIS